MKKTKLQFEKNHLKGETNLKSLVVLSALSVALLLCFGCTKSGAPSCTDESVKKLVLDISTGELRNQLLNQAMMMSPIRVPGTYDDLNKIKDQPGAEEIRKLILTVDQEIADAKISLANIRINDKRNDIKKCDCGGDLAFSNGKTFPITYTAQFTEDGKVYAEVAGLK